MSLEPIPSQREPFVDRSRYITATWWPWFKRLLDTVRINTAAVTTVTATIDQINQEWAVEINGSGHVIGLVRLDALDAETTFTVVADKFVIANPTDGTDVREFFIAGQVNGVDTVGIAGALVVDGTILARHLSVSSLSAISADIGTVTAGVIQATNGKTYINLNTGEWYSTT